MSYGNNDNYNTTSGSTGLGNTNQYGQSQGFDEQNIGGQSYGQSNIGGTQGTTRPSGNTDTAQFGTSGRNQPGSNTGREHIGSTGSDQYGSSTGMGGAGSGIGSTGDTYGSDPRNQGIGYGSDQSSGIGQQQGVQQQGMKPSMGDKMRGKFLESRCVRRDLTVILGGVEKGIGKMTGQPDLVEKGQERATGQFDSRRNF